MCSDERTNNGEPYFFLYQIVFKRTKLRLPLTGFERALLTKINVAPAQLHPNSWAFVKAFSILCNHFGHPPSVYVFLHFFKAKSPGKNLWVSFNGVAGRVLLTLFQQFYQVLASLGAVFNTVQLIKHEYDVEALKGYIGIIFTLSCLVVPITILLCLYIVPLYICMFTPMFRIAS